MTITASTGILPVILDGIPPQLRDAPRWLGWCVEERRKRDGTVELNKAPKLLSNPRRPASSNKPDKWGPFAAAIRAVEARTVDGIGFALCEGWVGVDLDGVRDPATGELNTQAAEIVRRLNTYTEVSPSGTGVKLFLRGSVPASSRAKFDGIDIEIYGTEQLDGARYFTVTGHHVPGTPATVASLEGDRKTEVERLLAGLAAAKTKTRPAKTSNPHPPQRDDASIDDTTPTHGPARLTGRAPENDDEVIEAGRRRFPEFAALWGGTIPAELGGDESRADYRLAGTLAYLCGPREITRVRRIMERSALRREKWDRDDYLDRTIAAAYDNRTKFYSWRDDDGPADLTNPTTCDELGLSLRYAAAAAANWRYVIDRECWAEYDTRRWCMTPVGPLSIGRKVAGELKRELRAITNRNAKVVRFVDRASSAAGIKAGLSLMHDLPGIRIHSERFDANPHLLNVLNGTIDLRSGEFRPHDPADLLTGFAPVNFDAKATCPGFLDFLADAFSSRPEVIAFVQRLLGASLSAEIREPVVACHVGPLGCGKVTLCEVVGRILGSYRGTLDGSVLLHDKHGREDSRKLAGIVGKRMLTISGIKSGAWDEPSLRRLAGSEAIPIERKYENQIDVTPTWHAHALCDALPQARENAPDFFSIIHLVRYTNATGENLDDARLRDSFADESAGILNWLLDGYRAFDAGGLAPPAVTAEARALYAASQDAIGRFIEARCVIGDPETTFAGRDELYEACVEWTRYHEMSVPTMQRFNQYLAAQGFKGVRKTCGEFRDRRFVSGIGLGREAGKE